MPNSSGLESDIPKRKPNAAEGVRRALGGAENCQSTAVSAVK